MLAKLAGLISSTFSLNLPYCMTIMLSAIPAAVTVMVVYLIVKHLTKNYTASVLAACVLLASGVFLSQATVVEEYTLSAMFLALAFWAYIKQGRSSKPLAALFIGLGLAVHIIILPIALLWLAVSYKEWRAWLKVIPITVLTGIAPYFLIVALLASQAPPLFAGYGFSWAVLNEYLGGTYVVGSLALIATPERLAVFLGIMVMSFGLAWIAIAKGLTKPRAPYIWLALIAIIFPAWYYITCLHSSTWTYLTWASPFLAILAGIGLSRLNIVHTKVVGIGTVGLMILAITFMNANVLTEREPVAKTFLNEMMSLPDGSAVIATRYAHRGFATYYAYSLGKDIIPIYYDNNDPNSEQILYLQYTEWLSDKYGIEGRTPLELAKDAMNKGKAVYIMEPRTELEKELASNVMYQRTGKYFYEVSGFAD